MAHRYARIDVDFFHKNTARKLLEEFGPAGPLVFIALILRAKDGSPPGTFSYPNDPIGWDRLGLPDIDAGFTLDEFFALTGRMKQTSRRRHGRVWDVSITRYAEWQKESRRYEEAVRKASKRAQTTADTKRTPHGTRSGHQGGPRTRTRTTPKPPLRKTTTKAHPCPRCPIVCPTTTALDEHLENVHLIDPATGEPLAA